jgi:hypothetical protein
MTAWLHCYTVTRLTAIWWWKEHCCHLCGFLDTNDFQEIMEAAGDIWRPL